VRLAWLLLRCVPRSGWGRVWDAYGRINDIRAQYMAVRGRVTLDQARPATCARRSHIPRGPTPLADDRPRAWIAWSTRLRWGCHPRSRAEGWGRN
jgi:hypothetical protein